jgi:hypothetical protein
MSQELLSYVFTDGFNHLAHLGSANRVVLNDMMALQWIYNDTLMHGK